MEEMVTSETDPAEFRIDLMSTERRDLVRAVIRFRHPLHYPEEPIEVECEELEVRLMYLSMIS